MQDRYRIVFEKLSEALHESGEKSAVAIRVEATPSEYDELAELREVILEVAEPPVSLYTTT